MSELRCIAQQVIKYLHYIIIITVYDQIVTGRFKNELNARIERCPRRIYRSLATGIDIKKKSYVSSENLLRNMMLLFWKTWLTSLWTSGKI